jgi:hypothetical protein
MLVVLHSIALLDNSLTKVRLPLISINKANDHLQATPNSNMTLADTKVKQSRALKRRVGYGSMEDDNEPNHTARASK